MFKRKVVKILKEVNKLKQANNLQVIDTHIHPLDVMGVNHFSEIANECKHDDYLKPGLLEIFNYSSIEKVGSRVYFKLFPNSVDSMIRQTYSDVGSNRILAEMEESLTDKSVLLSLEPWAPTRNVGKEYKDNKKFYILGSINPHSVELNAIESLIESYVKDYGIVGLKLHPNLQNFKPQPSHNLPEIKEKLLKIYSTAERFGLYILFHGGISNYTTKIDFKYGSITRSKTNGVLSNFCDENGESEILGKYNIAIIIAHIGHYGMIKVDYKLVKLLAQKYKNLFYDTSGISPKIIKNSLKIISSEKFVFGSDALYNRIAYNVAYNYLAAKKCNNGEKLEDILHNIFWRNFTNKVIARKF